MILYTSVYRLNVGGLIGARLILILTFGCVPGRKSLSEVQKLRNLP